MPQQSINKMHIVVPQIFMLPYHTELSLMLRSTREKNIKESNQNNTA